MALNSYRVEGMRIRKPSQKVLDSDGDTDNPLVFIVSGVFHEVTDNGEERKLSIRRREVRRSDVLAEGFALDKASGSLSLPAGQRGRPADPGMDADSIAAEIAALRKATK